MEVSFLVCLAVFATSVGWKPGFVESFNVFKFYVFLLRNSAFRSSKGSWEKVDSDKF